MLGKNGLKENKSEIWVMGQETIVLFQTVNGGYLEQNGYRISGWLGSISPPNSHKTVFIPLPCTTWQFYTLSIAETKSYSSLFFPPDFWTLSL